MPSARALPVLRLLGAAASRLRGAVGSAAVWNVNTGLGSAPTGAPGAPHGPGPGSEVLAGAGRGSGRAVRVIPYAAGVSPAHAAAVAAGRAGGQVRAGVGSGATVGSWVSSGAALL